jgi:hypothetical protein
VSCSPTSAADGLGAALGATIVGAWTSIGFEVGDGTLADATPGEAALGEAALGEAALGEAALGKAALAGEAGAAGGAPRGALGEPFSGGMPTVPPRANGRGGTGPGVRALIVEEPIRKPRAPRNGERPGGPRRGAPTSIDIVIR